MYDIGLPSKSSLFQIQGENFKSFQNKTSKKLFWYIMTSFFTFEETKKYFQQENYFGIPKDQIIIFSQGSLPCLELNGKIIMETKSNVSFAPNGKHQ
jgi:UDP-N-acetylglucosamine/UDP-N-acetylgalactosamine diphosphorylase